MAERRVTIGFVAFLLGSLGFLCASLYLATPARSLTFTAAAILGGFGLAHAAIWLLVDEWVKARSAVAMLCWGVVSMYLAAVLTVVGITVLPWLLAAWPIIVAAGVLTAAAVYALGRLGLLPESSR